MARFGAGLIVIGLLLALFPVLEGGWTWALLWPGGCFLAVGTAYLRRFAGIFGKRPDGSLHPLPRLLLLPYLLYTSAVWQLIRLLGRERAIDTLRPNVLLARRLVLGELPGGVETVVDLTAEFAEPAHGKRYASLPILDGGVPSLDAIRAALALDGTILIHCAQGHGRTALFAACLLLHRGEVTAAQAAVDAVLAVRPGARMNREQRAFVEAFASTKHPQSSPEDNSEPPANPIT